MKTSTKRKISRLPARIVCQYTNQTSQIQIVCIDGTAGVSFERTVMPQQQITFETPSESVLEVRTGQVITAIVSDRIPCIRLRAKGIESIRKAQVGTAQTKNQTEAQAKRRKLTSGAMASGSIKNCKLDSLTA